MKNRKGFTLIELIVVIAILGIISAVAIPRVAGSLKTARINAVKQNISIVENSINADFASKGTLPANAAAVNALLSGKTLTDMGITYQPNANDYHLYIADATAAPYSLGASDITGGATGNFPAPLCVGNVTTSAGTNVSGGSITTPPVSTATTAKSIGAYNIIP